MCAAEQVRPAAAHLAALVGVCDHSTEGQQCRVHGEDAEVVHRHFCLLIWVYHRWSRVRTSQEAQEGVLGSEKVAKNALLGSGVEE